MTSYSFKIFGNLQTYEATIFFSQYEIQESLLQIIIAVKRRKEYISGGPDIFY